jgi:hypothetical protein
MGILPLFFLVAGIFFFLWMMIATNAKRRKRQK